jgi:hypothetical protein
VTPRLVVGKTHSLSVLFFLLNAPKALADRQYIQWGMSIEQAIADFALVYLKSVTGQKTEMLFGKG